MTEIELDQIPVSAKGSYVLVVRLADARTITVGKRGASLFRAGYYVYAGSAMGGLKARIARHLRREKKHHWHIDYLLEEAIVDDVLAIDSAERLECEMAQAFNERYSVIEGFGSSDCRCPGHLFFSETPVTAQLPGLLNETITEPVRLVTGWRNEA